ncbi:unnamed protein product [Phyllotreta striolata]|uniref:PID domain-containing protein n=1 Tax=Phyllotreta striolata TaxID=444603 RepID=A0A9P0E049_PHYSR|nr:unnamed protein product [Phyllotreta striolata]
MTPNLPKEDMCNMNNAVIPRPPALPPGPLVPTYGIKPPPKPPGKYTERRPSEQNSSKASPISEGFRLVDVTCHNNDDTGSVYSLYKQKIDSMFESDSSSTKNSVQAKIEKMFNEVAQDNGMGVKGIGTHNFSVDYLGSVPLNEKVTSLSGLQNPLRELYFAYKKVIKTKKTLTGRLEISSGGLKVQYQGEKGDLEQLNSFPTIAVWSAVKFVLHDVDQPRPTYAFLPLITDPDNTDKRSLFRPLDDNEKKFITTEAHSPLFAVVMRKIGVQKQLECHGFVCQTSEDAIVIAATLYKSLVAHMKARENKPRNKNGVTTCMSVTSSLNKERSESSLPVRPPRKKRSSTSSVTSETDIISISDTKPLLNSQRLPKKSVKTKRAPKAPQNKTEDLDAILPYEEPNNSEMNTNNECIRTQSQSTDHSGREFQEIPPRTYTDKLNSYMTKEQKQLAAEIKQMMNDGGTKCLKKVVRKSEEPIRKPENSGDILTKVTIPRSGSFLNAGGLTRYKNKGSRSNDQGSGGSPLGFKEIFNELSLQEGLHSLDDILGVIIDPDGMSFNDLKPIYKEFLLKLSVTLTKDELYQRSKSIMRRQKKKMLKKSPQQKSRVKVGAKFKRLKHVFQRSFDMKLAKKTNKPTVTTAIPSREGSKLPESSISTSSYDTRQFRSKDELSSNKKQSYRKKSRRDRASTSEESDFFSLKKSRARAQGFSLLNNQNRNSSSGYVSCSECSYDSDTCTCVSADKCYCSLGQKNSSRKSRCHGANCQRDASCSCNLDNSVVYCGCDTDSCAESNKCYCPKGGFRSSVIAKLERKGFRQEPDRYRHKKLCKKNSNTKSTKSLEYVYNPTEAYYEKLKNKGKFGTQSSMPLLSDCDKFSMLNGGLQSLNSRMLYGSGMGPCRPVTVKNYQSTKGYRSVGKATAISSGGCSEALAVKKSAEIAALFSDIKLTQTTDIAHMNPIAFDSKNTYGKSYSYTGKFGKNQKTAQNHYTHLQKNKSALYSLKLPIESARNVAQSVRSSSNKSGKPNMYSAKNGLYTIQSQSDESRRSSSCEGRKIETREFYKFSQDMRNVSSNIENSLGYLP